jgi:hypothetical protein
VDVLHRGFIGSGAQSAQFFADTVEGRPVAKRQPRTLKVRCPRCQAAVPMSGSIIELGATWALLCPACKEISIA